jgi:hypothetical protein
MALKVRKIISGKLIRGRFVANSTYGDNSPSPFVKRNRRRRNSSTETDSSVRSPTKTSTEVRSPTRTATSTEAYTRGNVTVTGGAGAGANTTVHISRNPRIKGVKKITPGKIVGGRFIPIKPNRKRKAAKKKK